jgi:hypothetical protein
MQALPLIEADSVTVAAGNFELTTQRINPDGSEASRPLTTVRHRTVALIFEDSDGRQTIVPLGAIDAVRIGQDMINQAHRVTEESDEEDLETVEVVITAHLSEQEDE